uniref:AP2-like ethylene-responsive transcription factor AIL1 n=1 Tax=Erigeron canadensis TaxID=72917 RepID=UPI001CB99ABD|nr:AP2-like ethylene-responsive transcription factor AIL1 [Erigeron canadensis]
MKSPMASNNNDDNNENNKNSDNNNNNNNNNWLGFTLSPHCPDQAAAAQTSPSNAITLFTLPSHFNYQNMYYGGVEEGVNGGGLYSAFPIMPLKSDGSLCLMDTITRSQAQGMVTQTTPKLENFFGGVTMGTSDLDTSTMYSHQTIENHHNNIRPQIYQIQPQHYQDCYEMYQEEAKHSADTTGGLYLPTNGENWISNNYHSTGESGCLQSLNLSMSPGCSQSSSCVTISHHQQIVPAAATNVTENIAMETKKRGSEKVNQIKKVVHRKSIDTFGQRTSQYRGVTRHRWTGRYEAHLWDNTCKKEGQTRKGRQVYLGGYDMEEKAARSYDLAALKYWGPSTHINFPLEDYELELEEMKNMSRQEFVAHLRRRSSGFSRGASIYRGVTRHHQHGRWQARIGRVAGNKDLYLGTFSTQEDAAEAYDVAAIKFRGLNAVTNFDISRYNVEKIIESNTLLAGEEARRTKVTDPTNHDIPNQLQAIPDEDTTNECGSQLQDSPKRNNNLPMVLGNTWIPPSMELATTQLKSHVPIFASWSDA